MTRVEISVCPLVFLAVAMSCFAADAPPAFDVADVHASGHVTSPYIRGGVLRGGRYDLRTASMLDLISLAYEIEAAKVQGGPSWLEMDRFDISAKAPANTSPETLRLMLQTLLADRFKLKVHTESKPMPAYALIMGKGKPKLKESDGAHGSACQAQPQQSPQPGTVPYIAIACHGRSMEQLAQDIRNMGGAYISELVVDQTGLKGNWDFDLKWTGRGQLAAAGADGITIFDALEKQLGLKLELRKVPIPVIVVDSVNPKPTTNPARVTAALPPPPLAEFEVATVKPSMPGATNVMANLEHGRLDAQNVPLKQLVRIAWDIDDDALLAEGPKFLDSARFDITAKAPLAPGGETDEEDLRLMLRALLADRFRLKSHMEERPVDAYVLTAVKPKLQKADPSNRTGCKNGPVAGAKDPRIATPILNRLISCQNITMAQFVNLLPGFAGGYVHVGVLDSTNLTDAYDFTVNFSGINLLRNRPAQQSSGEGQAADPSGAISFPDAIIRQLGLKLEMKKRPMQVLVIDHIDEKPADN